MNGSPPLENHVDWKRIFSFGIVVALIFGIYISRLFTLQILQSEEWTARAEDNRTETYNLQALRGIIYDRNGTVLARNIPSYNVTITTSNLPDDPGAVQEIFRELSELINLPVNQEEITLENPYVPCISNHGIAQIAEYGEGSTPFQAVKVKCDVDEVVARVVQEKAMDWPGVGIEIEPIREYPTGATTANIVGFLGPIPAAQEEAFRAQGLLPNRDKVGYAGVELQFQDLLAGKNGEWMVEVDVAGQVMRGLQAPVEPTSGYNLRLTIDTRLQQALTAILEREINFWNRYLNTIRSTSGVVIALNPQTGEVLALVSYPTYENNRMARFIPAYYYNQLIADPANPLLNHAVGDVLPAGSVFKLVTAVGALNEGVVAPEQFITTPPKITITEKYFANDPGRERDFVDWNEAGFGQLNFVGGLSNSSNVYFYKLGGGYQDEVPEGLGICRLTTYAKALGYGEYPGIELPDEEKGLVPDPKWKRITHGEGWSTGDTYIASVGQGYVLATPLQVLMSAATIANDGKLMRPTLVREVLDGEGNTVQAFSPEMKWDITKDPVIQEFYDTTIRGCEPIEGQTKTVETWVIDKVQEGMRRAVTHGTLAKEFVNVDIAAAGKTGTAEYCDQYANAKNLCIPGNWPSHAWTVAYAPYDNPEVAVIAFVYNGGEGASVAGPIVRQAIEAYFQLKAIDTAQAAP
ncbi:MAG: penicillin-binding protein 2 [Anaerolineales bacterium]|nr:penicillin-binding protein 2 [Anaerolineales bacterium]